MPDLKTRFGDLYLGYRFSYPCTCGYVFGPDDMKGAREHWLQGHFEDEQSKPLAMRPTIETDIVGNLLAGLFGSSPRSY